MLGHGFGKKSRTQGHCQLGWAHASKTMELLSTTKATLYFMMSHFVSLVFGKGTCEETVIKRMLRIIILLNALILFYFSNSFEVLLI